jgi:hypothetical protein
MASVQPADAVDLFDSRHAAKRPWPGSIFPHTPLISALQAILRLSSISRGLHTCCGFPQFERALDANLVLVSLHAVDHAAFTERYRFAIPIYVLSTGALEFGPPRRQLFQNRLSDICLRGNGTNRTIQAWPVVSL